MKLVPELSGGQQQQQAPNNGSDMQRSASLAEEEEEAEEAEPAAEGAAAVLLLKNNAGTAVGVHWLDGPNAQYVKLVRIVKKMDEGRGRHGCLNLFHTPADLEKLHYTHTHTYTHLHTHHRDPLSTDDDR